MTESPDTLFPDGDGRAPRGPDRRAASLPTITSRVKLEKELARHEPGPPWREWFYFTGLKPWFGLGLLIVDAWVAAAWLEAGSYLALVASLAAAIYLEFLFYRYLWYRPGPEEDRSGTPFRPTWSRPVRYGRWTIDAARARAGQSRDGPAETGPDPREFL